MRFIHFTFTIIIFCLITSKALASEAKISKIEVLQHGQWVKEKGVIDLGFSNEIDTIKVTLDYCSDLFIICSKNPMIRDLMPINLSGGKFVPTEDIVGKKCWQIDPQQSKVEILFKLNSKYKRSVPFAVQSISENISDRNSNYLLIGLYIGLVALIILINIGCYIITRERLFRNYIFMLISVFLAQVSVIGLGANFLENLLEVPESSFVIIAANMSLFGSIFFAYYFIDHSPHRKLFKICSVVLLSVSLISLLTLLFGEVSLSYRILDVNNMITAVLILLFAFFSIEYTTRETAIFFLAWCVFCLSAICFILKDLGVLPWNNFTQYCMIVGSGIETVLVSLAIGVKFFLIQKAHKISELNLQLAQLENDQIYASLQNSNQNNLLLQMELNQTKLNPHFISNCLNGISSIISTGNTIDARKYIIRFGRLMRGLLHKDSDDRILLYEECILLHAYCSMEQFRTMNKFEIKIQVENNDDLFDLMIPKMAIQPLVENSIVHGLSHLSKRKPKLSLTFTKTANFMIRVEIEDNGIGRKASAIRNEERDQNHESVGIELISERLKMLMNEDFDYNPLTYEDLTDSEGSALGTKAILLLPLYKYPHKHPKRGDNPFKTGFNFQLSQ